MDFENKRVAKKVKVLLQNRIKQKNGSHMRRPFFFDKIKLWTPNHFIKISLP